MEGREQGNADAAGVGRYGPGFRSGPGGADWEVRAERIRRRRRDRRGIRAAGLAKQGLSAAGLGSPWRPFHESTGPGTWFEIPIRLSYLQFHKDMQAHSRGLRLVLSRMCVFWLVLPIMLR